MTVTKFTRTSQPQTPVPIDWSNPITKSMRDPINMALTRTNSGVAIAAGSLAKKRIRPVGVSGYNDSLDNSGTRSFTVSSHNVQPTSIPYTLLAVGSFASTSATAARLVSNYVNNSSGWYMGFNPTTRYPSIAITRAGLSTSVSGTVIMEAGKEHVLVGVVTDTELKIYVNGVLAGSASHSSPAVNSGTAVNIFFGLNALITDPAYLAFFNSWNRALSESEIKTVSENVWQVYSDLARPIFGATSTVVSISRPTADVTTSGWTGNPDNVTLFNNIDETTPSNTEFIESPNIAGGEFITFDFLPTRAAGTWDVTFHARFTGASAQVRIHLLDGSNVSQGVSSWQTVTSTFSLYTASVTTTGTSSRVKIEVQ